MFKKWFFWSHVSFNDFKHKLSVHFVKIHTRLQIVQKLQIMMPGCQTWKEIAFALTAYKTIV